MNTKKSKLQIIVAAILSFILIASSIIAISAFASETDLKESDDALAVTVNCDGEKTSFVTKDIVTCETLSAMGYNVKENDYISKSKDKNTNSLSVDVIRVENKTVVEEVPVKSTEIIIYNDEMYQDQFNIKKQGQDGVTQITYNIRYENGVEVSKVKLEEKALSVAVDTVKEVGTKARNPKSKKVSSAVIDEISGVIYTNTGQELSYSKVLTVTATAYSPASCGKSPSHPAYGITATGRIATYGVIAVDPSVIPLGSRVFITAPDGSWTYGTAIAADTGGAIKGSIIDLCYDTNAECFAFGRRTAKVYILD